jgi:beta-alanine--pyruvate transaminase
MMKIFRDEKLIDRAAQMAPYFIDAVFSLSDLPVVVDIRAIGLMAAVEVAVDGTPGTRGHEMQKRLYDAGVNIKSTGDNLIIAPPFISEKSHVDHMVSVLRDVLSKA